MADVEIPDPPTINRQLTTLVLEAGRRLGFEVASEYAIPGGASILYGCGDRPHPFLISTVRFLSWALRLNRVGGAVSK